MDTRKLVETPSVSEEAKDTQAGPRAETVKLVDMGQVSVETRGFIRGLEIGFTPRN